MSYKPNYCCECGEKIERMSWRLWTNRRFCQFCETQHGLQDSIYKIVFGLLILISIVGVGNLFRKPEKDLIVTQNQSAAAGSPNGGRNFAAQQSAPQNANQTIAQPVNQTKESGAAETKSPLAVSKPSEKVKTTENQPPQTAQEVVYFCGAQTKKGTPCTRRVRGGGRCFQHIGQPAMLPPEKLIASR